MSSGSLQETTLFEAGTGGYHAYRIPALIVGSRGTVLAFCEGRRGSSSDTGKIDVLVRRSTDGGATFGPVELVAEDGLNTVGNPCPVVDRDTGVIWLLLTHNLGHDSEHEIMHGTSEGSRTVWVTRSDDDGATWAPLREITATTKLPQWTWYATGPGVGIQMRSGRLVIPCDCATDEFPQIGERAYHAHVIYSDDHGATWQLGGVAGELTNECQVVERADGSLLLNMRAYHGSNRRVIAASGDGGLTWSELWHDEALIEPVCQASIVSYSGQPGTVLFSNPASTDRVNMTVRLSRDDGATWPLARTVYAGPAAYSCLTVLPDGSIGCLYERGEEHAYEALVLARFGIEWLEGE